MDLASVEVHWMEVFRFHHRPQDHWEDSQRVAKAQVAVRELRHGEQAATKSYPV